ncbi:MAG TPA: hypothetical protein GX405_04445 [Rhizobiales bacterium]|nr:hypothetical protein [Hyphomicrobiales bacterium]
MLLAFILFVPVFGLSVRSALMGDATEKVFFVVNLIMAWLLAIFHFGYPAIILPALCATVGYLAFLVVLTSGGLFTFGPAAGIAAGEDE